MHQGPVKGKSGMGGMVNVAQKTDVQQLFIQVCTNSGCTNSGYMPVQRWASETQIHPLERGCSLVDRNIQNRCPVGPSVCEHRLWNQVGLGLALSLPLTV